MSFLQLQLHKTSAKTKKKHKITIQNNRIYNLHEPNVIPKGRTYTIIYYYVQYCVIKVLGSRVSSGGRVMSTLNFYIVTTRDDILNVIIGRSPKVQK